MILSRAWRRLLPTMLAVSSIGIVPAHGQTSSPGMKHMQDVQRKAEQKARANKHPPAHSAQHKEAGSGVPASSP
ncbi:hypothetical protein D1Y85_10130 [Paraburkholderia dinghuensis]|uniref:Uncharacterized protein n=1 Tax=Paraburkholderia dinghuensis TaxID=2305225 RepID=A0A3N6Q3T4_9BURK|nr:hypothetical protein D1Y85_10130 [Paraburkholderia dinghuensis]